MACRELGFNTKIMLLFPTKDFWYFEMKNPNATFQQSSYKKPDKGCMQHKKGARVKS
jgi:hypothetical protein